ncbi:hypothetical protein ACKWTF_015565 [Chironomus riparius]
MKVVLILLQFATINYSFNIQCNYITNDWLAIKEVYECEVKNNLTTTSRELSIVENVSGSHRSGYKDQSVTAFFLKEKGINYFPTGLQHAFENIKAISIQNDKIKEIRQSDLKFLPKLLVFEIHKNEIEVIEDELFAYNPNLQYVSFSGNKIVHIGLKVFENLQKLTYLRLLNNFCINREAIDDAAETIKIIEDVKSKCYKHDYLIIKSDLQQLENSLVCVNAETSSIFSQQLQNLENKVKNSKISLPSSYKDKLKEISSIKTQNYWNSKQKLEDIEKAVTTSKIEASNLMNNIQNKFTTSFNDIKQSENSLQSTMNSIRKDQQSEQIKISSVKNTLDSITAITSTKSQTINEDFKNILYELNHLQASKTFNPEILNANVQILEKYLENSLLSCSQKQQDICNSSLKIILDSIKTTQTDLIKEVDVLNKNLDNLNTAMSLKSGNIVKIFEVIKDDIKKSLADLTSSQLELKERMISYDKSPKNNVENYINTRVENLEKIIKESTGPTLLDISKLVFMSIYGFFQTIVLIVIFFKFFQVGP